MLTTDKTNTKSIDIVVIYPCRVVPFDKINAEEIGYGGEVRVETSIGNELIAMKRAVKKEDFSAEKYPAPANKRRAGKDDEAGAPNKPVEKPLDRMNKEELLALAKKEGLEVPADATKAEILALLEN